LYPELEPGHSKSKIPDVVAFNQATTQALNPQALLKGLRAEIQLLFGDFGSGAVSDSLSGKPIDPRGVPGRELTVSS
jgi:ribonuclease P/MRP protein subunit POP5